jgi:putative colanic acid biosynthesis UDP-glucose lipid carrier transferase
MTQTDSKTTGGFEASAPQSVPVFVAALSEPLIAVGCFLAVTLLHGEPVGRAAMVLCILLLVLMFPGTNRYYEQRLNAAVDIASAWGVVLAILALCGYATDSVKFFEPMVLVWWALLTPLVQFGSVLAGQAVMRRHAQQPDTRRPALVIGAGPLGAKVAQALHQRRSFGSDFVGYLEDRQPQRCDPGAVEHIVGRFDEAADCIRRLRVRDVYIALPMSNQPRILQLLDELRDTTVSIYFVPDLFMTDLIQARMDDLGGVPVVAVCETPFTGLNAVVKQAFDFVAAAMILVLISPLMVAIAIAVKATSAGPVLFRQHRYGLDGERILVYKFRSMTVCENGDRITQAQANDRRVTPLGAFLRRTSLDELPQFINVLQGRMSIVGPRPHAVAHNETYRKLIKGYMVRHKVRPGITGWAQVNGCRGETETLDKMRRRIDYDLDWTAMPSESPSGCLARRPFTSGPDP